ncbi:hypothetical protein GW17_00042330 [Ensete ventricosum]|nr:hypothetical protein GW17_00042330 [Ensete ventricosum]
MASDSITGPQDDERQPNTTRLGGESRGLARSPTKQDTKPSGRCRNREGGRKALPVSLPAPRGGGDAAAAADTVPSPPPRRRHRRAFGVLAGGEIGEFSRAPRWAFCSWIGGVRWSRVMASDSSSVVAEDVLKPHETRTGDIDLASRKEVQAGDLIHCP